MAMTPDQAKEWARKNSKFLKLEDGEFITVKVKDMKSVPNQYDPEKETIQYTFELEDGSIKYWKNGNGQLAQDMATWVGKKVMIERHGEDTQTKYEVSLSLD